MTDTFDHVIVGGGTAAGILAWRLSEAGRSVCVLEAGPADRNPYIRVPAGFMKTLFDPRITFQLKSDPDPATDNRTIPYTQGKVLGGSSSVNGMVYNRGQAADFDRWAQLGNPGWGYADVLPYFRRTEARVAPASDPEPDRLYRGSDGPLTVSTSPWDSEIIDAFIAAAQACGHPLNADYNGASQEGVGRYQSAIRNGRRMSTAKAFLHPARRLNGIDVRTHAHATNITLTEGRATGVVYRRGGVTETVHARAGVILSAGTVNSPKLLQLSGIGPAALLRTLGIDPVHDLPGVGDNLRDHYSPRIVARVCRGVASLNQVATGLPLLAQIARWLTGRPSLLALSPALVHVFGKSAPTLEWPDYSLVFTPGSYKAGFIGVLDDAPGITCGAWQMRPESSGYVRLRSADPADPPHINPRYLTDPLDIQVLLAGLRAVRAIFAMPPLAGLIESELFPGRTCASDDDLIAFARAHGNSSYHLVGSCKMGPAEQAGSVVDARLRVHGIASLHVIDASIMPTMPSANTYAATMLVAEKGSDMVLKDTRQ